MELHDEFIRQALGLKGLGKLPTFAGIATDSRSIRAGELFIALKGEAFDGAEFIPQALARGALAVICEARSAPLVGSGAAAIVVDDTLAAFRHLAAAWRRSFRGPVVAVAGSVGKTSTKDMLRALLRGRWPKVLATQGSQNGYVGIPMTLMNLTPDHGVAVIEVGIDEVGAMAQHCELVAPDAALVTAIAAEHLEKLHDLPTVAREERLILEHVARSGALLALNLDDPWLTEVPKKQNSARALGFSLDGAAVPQGVEGLQGHLSREGVLSLSGLGLDGFSLKVPMPGRHNARNLLGAVALARGLGLERDAIKTGLALFEGSGARSEIRRLGDGSVVLCDYYNASPASVAAGLDLAEDLFRQQAGRPVLWVCLGDMLELGREELEWHRGLSPRVIATSSTEVMCLGKRMASLAEELRTQGFKGQVRTYEGYEELARDLIRERRPGDVILIKGSRGMKMERVWQELNSDGAP